LKQMSDLSRAIISEMNEDEIATSQGPILTLWAVKIYNKL